MLDCTEEAYSENGFDTENQTLQLKPKIATLLDDQKFPLRNSLTCVRSQGIRGSCTSFSIVAAVETYMKHQYGITANYSEQELYARSKLYWSPSTVNGSFSNYGEEGAMLSSVFQGMVQENYKFLPGAKWPYNPAFSRSGSGPYAGSCINYPGNSIPPAPWSNFDCHETNHQQPFTSNPSSYGFGFGLPAAANYQIKPGLETFAELGPTQYTAQVKAFLNIGVPIVGAYWITNSSNMLMSGGMGIVNPNISVTNLEPSFGGHAVAIVGWVDNQNLPPNYPDAYGGGYWIAKNSWGTNWADHGYFLMSYWYYAVYGQGFWIPVVKTTQ